ncbi:T9SS type A sorting domain-containing protein [Niastella caeni]|uniref:T9SS type A sorting domain-containing protein n=1 Tax=Niastella caeni TaxID=2569763 RepID=A0A4S8H5Z1_9BACT|nr:T9SS type A sorting domain-containing protein [Niastella caeni]THU30210.1 T9SS type A sorting domain-containing protein [Niastella caeni]
MKKIYSLIMALAIAMIANAQLVFLENFSGFTVGNLGTQGSWVQSGSGTDVQISSTSPLIYSGYTSGTQFASVSPVDGTDPNKLFTSSINTNTNLTVYMSFVVRVASAPASDGSPVYSISLINTGDPDRPLRFYIATEPGNANEVRFGILTGNSTNVNNIAWTPTTASFATNTTFLILIRYDNVSAGGNNDDAYLWVNPVLTSEPATGTANATLLDANEANYGAVLNAIEISQSSINSPDADFDGFRIAYGTTSAIAWTNLDAVGAPLPVQLTSFNAAEEGFSTKLVWNVAEESGITSYEIEKSTDGKNFTAIGSVKAANLKTYSYTDMQPGSAFSYYRLKLIEMDGTFKYSYIISVKSKLSTTISLLPNPVKSILMVQHPKAGAAAHIQIINALGQMVKEIQLPANAVISNIDMSGFTSGLYHVVFKNGSAVIKKTVLKH